MHRKACTANIMHQVSRALRTRRMVGTFILDRQRVAAVNHTVQLLMGAVAAAESAAGRAAGAGRRRVKGGRAAGAQQR